jgi:hypothetical protein
MRFFAVLLALVAFLASAVPAVTAVPAAASAEDQAKLKLKEMIAANPNFFKSGIWWPNDADRKKDWGDLWREPLMTNVNHKETGKEIEKIRQAIVPLYEMHRCNPADHLLLTVLSPKSPNIPLIGSCGNYRGTVLFFDEALIPSWSEQEIRAAVAHEFAHLLPDLNRLMAEAVQSGSLPKRHMVEYLCDGVAVLASKDLGDDPKSMSRYLGTIAKDRRKNGFAETQMHPSTGNRQTFLKDLY